MLHEALRINTDCQATTRKLYIMLARNAEKLGKMDETEYLLKLSISDDFDDTVHIRGREEYCQAYIQAHYYYGNFLMKHTRWKEAKHQFEICLKHRPNVPNYHYKLAHILWNLGDTQGFHFHLDKVLEMDPYHSKAKFDERRQARLTGMVTKGANEFK